MLRGQRKKLLSALVGSYCHHLYATTYGDCGGLSYLFGIYSIPINLAAALMVFQIARFTRLIARVIAALSTSREI